MVLALRTSRAVGLMLFVMGLLATIAIIISGLPWQLKLAFLLLTLLLARVAWLRFDRRGPRQMLLNDEHLLIQTAAGKSITVSACKGLFLSPWYLGFTGLDERGRRRLRVGIFRDQLEREAYRQLSAWFRERQQ